MIKAKSCRICNEIKPAAEFYKHKTNSDGLHSYCKVCARAKSSKWGIENRERKYKRTKKRMVENPEYYRWYRKRYYDNNREKVAEDLRAWQIGNRDKMKMYQITRTQNKKHEISKSEWQDCKEYFSNSCAYCGMTVEEHMSQFKQDLHKEHVNHEGANDLSNCVPSCRSCNSKKWTFTFSEWYIPDNPDYDINRHLRIAEWLEKDFKKYLLNKKENKTG